MSLVNLEAIGNVAVLRLQNGVINAINPQMVDELSRAVGTVRREARGVVLSGREKFFCIGFDLPELLNLKQDSMARFFDSFNALCLELFALPLPTACAVSGHAIAGGCILALTCDYRFAAQGKTQLGLNEIQLGIPVPYLADMLLRDIVGSRNAGEMIYRGRFMPVADARDIGLIDEIVAVDELEARAVDNIAELAGLSQDAFAEAKANRIEPIRRRYENEHAAKADAFLRCWFSPPVQELLLEASKKF